MNEDAAREPGAGELAEPMRSRWSPSVFDDRHELGAAEVETLLHAAQWAPSFGNSQPWSYVVALRGSAAHRTLVEHLSRGNAGWVPRASLVLLTAVQVAPDEQGNDVKDPDYARYDLGQSAAHVTLQAQAMGLHTHQFAGYDREATASALGVPEHVRLMAGIAVGVRGDPGSVPERDREREHRPRTRRPLGEIAYVDRWGVPWGG